MISQNRGWVEQRALWHLGILERQSYVGCVSRQFLRNADHHVYKHRFRFTHQLKRFLALRLEASKIPRFGPDQSLLEHHRGTDFLGQQVTAARQVLVLLVSETNCCDLTWICYGN